MSLAYFDCFSGASGDMILGALLDAGVDEPMLRAELSKLDLSGYRWQVQRVRRQGIAASQFTVELEAASQPHRHLSEILELIDQSALSDTVKARSGKVFRHLAEAEARVHGTSPEKVGFHEVGAVDSILDIVGAVVGLELLEVRRLVCSPFALGRGTVRCAHGVVPVPAPATVELLRGVPVEGTEIDGELTTPTGAALLTSLADGFGPLPPMVIERLGLGAGQADRPARPNVLRVFLGQTVASSQADSVFVIEANLDDQSPEACGYAVERLFQAGALDVFVGPLQMKKSRPGMLLSAIGKPEQLDDLCQVILRETSTFGVRYYPVERRKIAREERVVETRFGRVRLKVGRLDGQVIKAAPEYEDCRRVAQEKGIPFQEVYAEAVAAFRNTSD